MGSRRDWNRIDRQLRRSCEHLRQWPSGAGEISVPRRMSRQFLTGPAIGRRFSLFGSGFDQLVRFIETRGVRVADVRYDLKSDGDLLSRPVHVVLTVCSTGRPEVES